MWPELLPQLCNLLNSEDYNTCEVRGASRGGLGCGGGGLRLVLTHLWCTGGIRGPAEDL